jgi:hypothetical protein
MHGPTCIFWANLTPFSEQVEQRAAVETKPLSPPDEFVCAISQQLMLDPVAADEGVTFILDCHRIHCPLNMAISRRP